jgi:hypothetical protein
LSRNRRSLLAAVEVIVEEVVVVVAGTSSRGCHLVGMMMLKKAILMRVAVIRQKEGDDGYEDFDGGC